MRSVNERAMGLDEGDLQLYNSYRSLLSANIQNICQLLNMKPGAT